MCVNIGQISTLCSTQEDGERSGAILKSKRFPRNPEEIPNVGCKLDSFPCREKSGGKRSEGISEDFVHLWC